jgi:DNA ligase 1
MKLFAETCEKLSTESSTLNKIEIISSTLKEIQSNEELTLFSLYLTGAIYPSSIQKTINVGKAWVRDATIKLLGIDKDKWEEAYNKFGEVSETVEYLLSNFPKTKLSDLPDGLFIDKNKQHVNSSTHQPATVSLQDFQDFIETLNQNSKSLIKVALIAELLDKLSPLEAKYASKLIMQKMRIGVQEATVEDGIAKAFDEDKKKVKQLNFYIGNIGEVAVRIKERNYENIEFVLFHPIKAMLASAEVDIEDIFKRMGENVWVEYKYDGIRAHIHKSGERVELFTRDLKRITEQFPEVVEFFKNIKTPENFLLDGEIVPYRDEKIQAFADLQKRLGRKEKIDEAVKENPTRFVAYDFLYLRGETLFDKTLLERREMLEKEFERVGMLFSTKAIVKTKEEFTNFFVQSKSEGREGLMVKNPESKYESGKRGIHWLKYKQTLDPLDVVVLKVEYGEGKNAKYLSNFTFGVWDEKKENLIPVGRVYSGSKEEDLKYFTEYMPTIATEKLQRGFELEPKVIFEVGFENIQKSERYSSGYAVRFPRILRIRTGDKPLDEISTIDDVKRGWEKLNV